VRTIDSIDETHPQLHTTSTATSGVVPPGWKKC